MNVMDSMDGMNVMDSMDLVLRIEDADKVDLLSWSRCRSCSGGGGWGRRCHRSCILGNDDTFISFRSYRSGCRCRRLDRSNNRCCGCWRIEGDGHWSLLTIVGH